MKMIEKNIKSQIFKISRKFNLNDEIKPLISHLNIKIIEEIKSKNEFHKNNINFYIST